MSKNPLIVAALCFALFAASPAAHAFADQDAPGQTETEDGGLAVGGGGDGGDAGGYSGGDISGGGIGGGGSTGSGSAGNGGSGLDPYEIDLFALTFEKTEWVDSHGVLEASFRSVINEDATADDVAAARATYWYDDDASCYSSGKYIYCYVP